AVGHPTLISDGTPVSLLAGLGREHRTQASEEFLYGTCKAHTTRDELLPEVTAQEAPQVVVPYKGPVETGFASDPGVHGDDTRYLVELWERDQRGRGTVAQTPQNDAPDLRDAPLQLLRCARDVGR